MFSWKIAGRVSWVAAAVVAATVVPSPVLGASEQATAATTAAVAGVSVVDPGLVEAAATPVAAAARARRSGRRVEVMSERTETSSTFVNPDGSQTVSLSTEPVHVRRGEEWVPVDDTLVREGTSLRVQASAAGVVLGGAGLGRVFTPGGPVQLGWASALGSAEELLPGRAIFLRDGPADADVVLDVLPRGFAFSVRFARRPSGPVAPFRVPLRLPAGMQASQPDVGGQVLLSSHGAQVA